MSANISESDLIEFRQYCIDCIESSTELVDELKYLRGDCQGLITSENISLDEAAQEYIDSVYELVEPINSLVEHRQHLEQSGMLDGLLKTIEIARPDTKFYIYKVGSHDYLTAHEAAASTLEDLVSSIERFLGRHPDTKSPFEARDRQWLEQAQWRKEQEDLDKQWRANSQLDIGPEPESQKTMTDRAALYFPSIHNNYDVGLVSAVIDSESHDARQMVVSGRESDIQLPIDLNAEHQHEVWRENGMRPWEVSRELELTTKTLGVIAEHAEIGRAAPGDRAFCYSRRNISIMSRAREELAKQGKVRQWDKEKERWNNLLTILGEPNFGLPLRAKRK